MLNNPRNYLPKSRPPKEEVELAAKSHILKQASINYKMQHCDNKGKQLDSNILSLEQEGVDSLQLRKEKGEIVISTTDKSNNLTVSRQQ